MQKMPCGQAHEVWDMHAQHRLTWVQFEGEGERGGARVYERCLMHAPSCVINLMVMLLYSCMLLRQSCLAGRILAVLVIQVSFYYYADTLQYQFSL